MKKNNHDSDFCYRTAKEMMGWDMEDGPDGEAWWVMYRSEKHGPGLYEILPEGVFHVAEWDPCCNPEHRAILYREITGNHHVETS